MNRISINTSLLIVWLCLNGLISIAIGADLADGKRAAHEESEQSPNPRQELNMPNSNDDFSLHDQQIRDEELQDFIPDRMFDAHAPLANVDHGGGQTTGGHLR